MVILPGIIDLRINMKHAQRHKESCTGIGCPLRYDCALYFREKKHCDWRIRPEFRKNKTGKIICPNLILRITN